MQIKLNRKIEIIYLQNSKSNPIEVICFFELIENLEHNEKLGLKAVLCPETASEYLCSKLGSKLKFVKTECLCGNKLELY